MLNKFGAKKVWVSGNTKVFDKQYARSNNLLEFDSEMEADYYLLIKDNVDNLKLHPKYLLQPEFVKNGEKFNSIYYEADFEFVEHGVLRIVDIKGFETDEFLLKRKIFEYVYQDYHLEVLKYSKTTGWVELCNYKKIMKTKKKEIIQKKNDALKELELKKREEAKREKELVRLKQLLKKDKLTKVEKQRVDLLLERYKEYIISETKY